MSGLWPRLSFAPLDQPVALTGFHLSKFVLEEVSIKPDGMKGRERERGAKCSCQGTRKSFSFSQEPRRQNFAFNGRGRLSLDTEFDVFLLSQFAYCMYPFGSAHLTLCDVYVGLTRSSYGPCFHSGSKLLDCVFLLLSSLYHRPSAE